MAVLVAIAIPIFNSQLEKSRDATTVANIRSAYAEAQTAFLTSSGDTATGVTYTAKDGGGAEIMVPNVVAKGKSTKNNEHFSGETSDLVIADVVNSNCSNMDGTAGTYNLTFTYDSDGKITALTAATASSGSNP